MIKLKCNKNLLKNDKKVLTISKVYDIITAIKGKGVLNMWTETKSLALSRILACAATALIAALAFFLCRICRSGTRIFQSERVFLMGSVLAFL